MPREATGCQIDLKKCYLPPPHTLFAEVVTVATQLRVSAHTATVKILAHTVAA